MNSAANAVRQQNQDHNVDLAVRDLEDRTLANLNSDFSRIVYLSGTRDYNTGIYRHEGLALRFGEDAAQAALAHCHQTVFRNLLDGGLPALVEQLAAYIESTGAGKARVLQSWRQMEAYRVLIPGACDSLRGDFFISNIKIALEILRVGAKPYPADSPVSPPLP
jgi:hypothetical protein